MLLAVAAGTVVDEIARRAWLFPVRGVFDPSQQV